MRTSGPRRVKVVHENLKEDAPAYISAPRNDLPLSTDVQRHVFIAGGIGITPFSIPAKARLFFMARISLSSGHDSQLLDREYPRPRCG